VNIQIFALVWITTFIIGMRIVNTIQDHKKAQDAKEIIAKTIRDSEAKTETQDARRRAAEAEERAAQEKAKLAELIGAMNEEQLAAFNKALEEPKKEYVPFYIPSYPVYNQLPMVPYYGPRWWANP